MARKLREQNKMGDGANRDSGNGEGDVSKIHRLRSCLGGSATKEKPAIPAAHEGLRISASTQSETRDGKLYYSTEEWGGGKESAGQEVFGGDMNPHRGRGLISGIVVGRPPPSSLEQFLLNWLVRNSNFRRLRGGGIQSRDVCVAKGTRKMSHAALGELTSRRSNGRIRTGELLSRGS